MLLSKSCVYGLRASLYIASLQTQRYVSIRDISEELNISFHFLTKILQTLTHEGIMESFRGPNGGIALARPATAVTLFDIVQAIDGHGLFRECILGLPGCGHRKPCPLHEEWGEARDRIRAMFEQTTLASLADKVREFNMRIKDVDVVDTVQK